MAERTDRPPAMPDWVKAFILIGAILVVVIAVHLLTGGSRLVGHG